MKRPSHQIDGTELIVTRAEPKFDEPEDEEEARKEGNGNGDDMTDAEREFMSGNPEKKFAEDKEMKDEEGDKDKEMNDVD